MTGALRRDDGSAIDGAGRAVVGVFSDPGMLEDAIESLQMEGFDRAQLDILASGQALEARLGESAENGREPASGCRAPLGTLVSRHEIAEGQAALAAGLLYIGSFAATGVMVATGGGLVAVIAASIAAGGAGGALGVWLARLLGRRHARTVAGHLRHGGLLLLAQVIDTAHERRALEIMTRHGAGNVHAHQLGRGRGAGESPVHRWPSDPFLLSGR